MEYREARENEKKKRGNLNKTGAKISSFHLGLGCHVLGPPHLGLNKAAGLLTALGPPFKRPPKPSLVPVLLSPVRKIENGSCAVKEGKAHVAAAAHLLVGFGNLEKVVKDVSVVQAELALRCDGAQEHGHRLGWVTVACPKHGLAIAAGLGKGSKLRVLVHEPHAVESGQGVTKEGESIGEPAKRDKTAAAGSPWGLSQPPTACAAPIAT